MPVSPIPALLLILVCHSTLCFSSSWLRQDGVEQLHIPDISVTSQELVSSSQSKVPSVSETSAEFVADVQFKGSFLSQQKKALFDYLSVETGDIEAMLFHDEGSSTNLINSFGMILFDPVYHDQRAVELSMKIGKISSNGSWEGVNQKAQISYIWKERERNNVNVSDLNYTIRIKNILSKNIEKVTMELHFESKDFKFSAELVKNHEKLSTLGYCFYVTIVVGIQIASLFVLLQRIETVAPNVASKLSLTTVAICNIEDFYLTMVHIEYIMTSASSSYLLYIFPSVAYIILFVIFDMKLLFLVWRAHYMREIDNPQAMRKKLTTFYIKFYIGLFAYLTLTYFFSFDPWMIVLQNMLMLPQIVHNARVGNNPGFEPLYLFGFLGARFLIPLYERSCPSNHFLLVPIPGLVIALGVLYCLQILILFLQFKQGPRFFIPKMLQPNYYDYTHKIKLSEETREMECSICLLNFFEEHTGLDLNGSSLDAPIVKEAIVMKTPCGHYYHRDCLISWIDVKLECPSCRNSLPPL